MSALFNTPHINRERKMMTAGRFPYPKRFE